MPSTRKIVAGNWKMNTDVASGIALAANIAHGSSGLRGVEIVVGPPFVSLLAVRDAVSGTGISVAAQNMHADDSGAFTGEVAPPMLVGVCEYVIIGHSERRQFFGETDESVGRKAAAALRHGLRPIICVGETLDERESGQATEVIRRQVVGALAEIDPESASGKLAIAYEPVWAIGTGRAATPEIADQVMRGAIYSTIGATLGQETASDTPLLYGGSVNPANAAEFATIGSIDGALVGGASLDADSFLSVVAAFAASG